jgi:hypothetical protein
MNSENCRIEQAFLNSTSVPIDMRLKNSFKHAFKAASRVNLRGDIDCSYDGDSCLLIFKITWDFGLHSVRFAAGDPNAPDDEHTPPMQRPAFVGGRLGPKPGCPVGHDWTIFPEVLVSANGQTISVLNANPVNSPPLAYKLNIVARKTIAGPWRVVPIDPRIINR